LDRALLAELAEQDAILRHRGLELWLGAEPTFTDRSSQEPWWLGQAEGGDKLERARTLLLALAPRLSGDARLLRLEGRQCPGEEAPRLGVLLVQGERARREVGGLGAIRAEVVELPSQRPARHQVHPIRHRPSRQ